MECEVAREALSARVDGERESVPAARVDEHVAGCRDCQAWVRFVDQQVHHLPAVTSPDVDQTPQILARVDSTPTGAWVRSVRWLRFTGIYAALFVVGLVMVGVGVAQMAGLHFGMTQSGPMSTMSGDHLMNESTAWSLALGVCLVAAARWHGLIAGLAVVLGVFVVVLFAYVVHDAVASDVTMSRGVSHLPVVAAFLCAAAAHRIGARSTHPPAGGSSMPADDDRSVDGHGRIRAVDDSAA
ncbi:hypothetical protein GCM10007298_16090 [Williamsia phyllosphaerae]|uniref:Zinc-finger domain-containing protein n=1 Tax=Williamsia phyllosphaerae TaxID=885042 RepID=A0ABQ1UN50_9NOCA|nr:hypothetical protein GCM10007298_16090 [Williamsia phyllosphaerae]